jgi:hypothetical protein
MKDFNWDVFKGKLTMKGMTIKEWCQIVALDYDRYSNIRIGRVNPTEEEIDNFKKVVEVEK